MNNLITLEQYKQAKALTSPKNDEQLEYIISAVSQLVKTYCGNSFNDYVTTAKVEYHDVDYAYAVDHVFLEEFPVIEVVSIEERLNYGEEYTALTTNVDYVLKRSTDSIVRIDSYWPKGVESVKVEYKAGYAEIPLDLELAVIDLVTFYSKEEYKTIKSLQGSTMQNAVSSSLKTNIDFPDHIKRVLDLYREIK